MPLKHLYEDLDGLILCHTELIVELSGILCALLGALPELTGVATRKWHDILL